MAQPRTAQNSASQMGFAPKAFGHKTPRVCRLRDSPSLDLVNLALSLSTLNQGTFPLKLQAHSVNNTIQLKLGRLFAVNVSAFVLHNFENKDQQVGPRVETQATPQVQCLGPTG